MGHVFHLAWYMNGVGFGDSSRTSVPKIMASDPPVSYTGPSSSYIFENEGGHPIMATTSAGYEYP